MATGEDQLNPVLIQNILEEAVLAGAAAILQVRGSGPVVSRVKGGQELVTAADEASDAEMLAIFRLRVSSVHPEISLHLEESGRSGLSRKVIGADPLDGTNHLACGGNLYAVQAH